jgi:hypothetical protein
MARAGPVWKLASNPVVGKCSSRYDAQETNFRTTILKSYKGDAVWKKSG